MPDKNSSRLLNKVIKGSVYALIFLVPLFFLPLQVGSLDFHKQALLVLLTMIGLSALVLQVLVKREFRVKRTVLNYLVLFLVLVLGASTFLSWDPAQSFFGTVGMASAGFLTWLCLAIFFFLAVNNFDSLKEVQRLVYVGLASSLLVGLFGWLQIGKQFILPWSFTHGVSFNTIGSVNALGLFMAAILPLVIALFWVKEKLWERVTLAFLGLVSFVTVILVNFWMTWICLGAGMIALIIFLKASPGRINDSWVIAPVILLVLTVSFALILPHNLPGLPNLPLPQENLLPYGSVFNMGKQIISGSQGQIKALVGTGPSTFGSVYNLFQPDAISQSQFWSLNLQRAPSQMFGMMATTGILGVAALLSLIVGFAIIAGKFLVRGKQGKFDLSQSLQVGLFSSWVVLAVGKFVHPSTISIEFSFWLLMTLLLVIIFNEK